MKFFTLILILLAAFNFTFAQNVGIGTTTPTENLHVVGNKALFDDNYLSIGPGGPATGYTMFQINKNINNYLGMYINSGSTGTPYYGYALNGTAKAYTSFNSAANQFEYHQTSDATPEFYINGNTKAVFNTGFVGIGTSTPTTGFTGFAMKSAVNNFYGSYIDAGTTGTPFYGFALNGVAKGYLAFSGPANQLEYHQTSDATPEFYINGNTKAVFNTGFVGIGTGTPTTGYTGFAMKSSVNNFYGSYIDAGATGTPFYGYALNGVAKAYTSYSGPNNRFEYHHTSDAIPDFFIGNTDVAFPNSDFLGIGTTTPTTGFTGLALKTTSNNFYGSYIDAGPTGTPFYGYALNGVAKAYTTYSGVNNRFEYHHSSDAASDFYLSDTQAAFPNINFMGIGTTTPTTGYTGLTLKTSANNFYGSYIDAGPTGTPFYGYALNGVAKAYTTYSGVNNRFEYHHSSDAVSDFYLSDTQAAFPNIDFMGIGTSTPTTGFTGFAMKTSANNFYGSYIDAGPTGEPFYGYALNGVAKAYTTFNGNTNQFEYHHNSDATPDFSVSNTKVTFPIQAQMTIGTSTPYNGYTGLTLDNNVNTYYGMYINSGASGTPFYGYALDGATKAFTDFNSTTGNWEINIAGTAVTVASSGMIHSNYLNGGATSLSTDASGNIIRTPSDAKLKTNINDIDNALDKVMQLRGVTYDFIDQARFGSNRQMGFIAQELEPIVPEAVSSGGEYKSVNYQVMTALLTEAVKEQEIKIENQQKENDELKSALAQLMKRVEVLEKR